MATLQDYYNTGDNSGQGIDSGTWYAQTFTVSDTYQILSVKLLLYRIGTPGTITVQIRTASGNLPTSTVLTSGTSNANTLPTGSPYEWREITFSSSQLLTSGVQYAIVVGSSSGTLGWRIHVTSPTYAGGRGCVSNDSGVNWGGQNTVDTMFETWGDPPTYKSFSSFVNILSTSTSILNVQGIRLLESNTQILSNQSVNLTVIGTKQLSSTENIQTYSSADLSILGSNYLESKVSIKFSSSANLDFGSLVQWPLNRPQEYKEENIWGYDPVLKIYRWMNMKQGSDILSVSGGRYHQQLIVVGHRCLYYTEI